MHEPAVHIATRIREARKKKRLSQRELGKKIGIAQAHISKIERALVDLKTSTLIEIARALDLEIMLVSRELAPSVRALDRGSSSDKPRYQLGDDND